MLRRVNHVPGRHRDETRATWARLLSERIRGAIADAEVETRTAVFEELVMYTPVRPVDSAPEAPVIVAEREEAIRDMMLEMVAACPKVLYNDDNPARKWSPVLGFLFATGWVALDHDAVLIPRIRCLFGIVHNADITPERIAKAFMDRVGFILDNQVKGSPFPPSNESAVEQREMDLAKIRVLVDVCGATGLVDYNTGTNWTVVAIDGIVDANLKRERERRAVPLPDWVLRYHRVDAEIQRVMHSVVQTARPVSRASSGTRARSSQSVAGGATQVRETPPRAREATQVRMDEEEGPVGEEEEVAPRHGKRRPPPVMYKGWPMS